MAGVSARCREFRRLQEAPGLGSNHHRNRSRPATAVGQL